MYKIKDKVVETYKKVSDQFKKGNPMAIRALQGFLNSMAELTDLSGPFNPGLKFEDLSKELLVKILRVWQWSWLQLDAGWYEEVLPKFGLQPGFDCDLEMWLRCADRCNTRYAKIAKIPMNDIIPFPPLHFQPSVYKKAVIIRK